MTLWGGGWGAEKEEKSLKRKKPIILKAAD